MLILNDAVYCKHCADLPICSYCKEVILEKYLFANELYWHEEHFYCQKCKKLIENKEFFVKDSIIVCDTCGNKAMYYTLKQLINKPYPTGIDITKREVLFSILIDVFE